MPLVVQLVQLVALVLQLWLFFVDDGEVYATAWRVETLVRVCG